MNFYIAALAAALIVCGIVLASLILRRIGKERLQTHASLAAIEKFTQSGGSLNVQVYAINFLSVSKLLDKHLAAVSTSFAQPGQGAAQPSAATRFLEHLQQCIDAGLRTPDAIRGWVNNLKREQYTTSEAASGPFRKNAADILQALLHVADDEIDRNRENRSLQDALDRMARLASLDFIAPSEDAPFDDRKHFSHKKRTDPNHAKDTIASVTRRGLMRAGSKEVILPALVVTYK